MRAPRPSGARPTPAAGARRLRWSPPERPRRRRRPGCRRPPADVDARLVHGAARDSRSNRGASGGVGRSRRRPTGESVGCRARARASRMSTAPGCPLRGVAVGAARGAGRSDRVGRSGRASAWVQSRECRQAPGRGRRQRNDASDAASAAASAVVLGLGVGGGGCGFGVARTGGRIVAGGSARRDLVRVVAVLAPGEAWFDQVATPGGGRDNSDTPNVTESPTSRRPPPCDAVDVARISKRMVPIPLASVRRLANVYETRRTCRNRAARSRRSRGPLGVRGGLVAKVNVIVVCCPSRSLSPPEAYSGSRPAAPMPAGAVRAHRRTEHSHHHQTRSGARAVRRPTALASTAGSAPRREAARRRRSRSR